MRGTCRPTSRSSTSGKGSSGTSTSPLSDETVLLSGATALRFESVPGRITA